MNSNPTKPHHYQLAILIIVFVIVLVTTVLIYTKMNSRTTNENNPTPETLRAEVERNFGVTQEISPENKASVENSFGARIKK